MCTLTGTKQQADSIQCHSKRNIGTSERVYIHVYTAAPVREDLLNTEMTIDMKHIPTHSFFT